MALLPHYSRKGTSLGQHGSRGRGCWAKVYPNGLEMALDIGNLGITETHDAGDFGCAGCMIQTARYEITVADPRPAIVRHSDGLN
jgi:hypothetical protein